MANIKKLLSIILSMAICMALFAGMVNAETSNVDIDEMAAALNRLNILQGSNGDYLLYDNLERAQATALIIRMLGKENYVKENSDDLKTTKYADVPENSWFAPYIGYSTIHNIVGGNLDGSFTPLEYVTEKAFLKMALCALGYEYGNDFNWSNVYQKAYEVGVVKDSSYSTRTEDDSDYLRSQAIEALYRSLNTYKKGTQTKMILSLVEDGAFTSEEVAASDILSDDMATKIDSVAATAPNIIEVLFNEDIQDVKTEDISIYAESDEDKVLDVKSIAFGEDSIQIITAGQISSETYVLDIESVTDMEGNISGRISSTFEGYTQKDVNSEYFKIGKVEHSSGNNIHVYFTHPVNVNSESPIHYELLQNGSLLLAGSAQNMTVKKLPAEDNVVSIYITGIRFEEGEVYTLRVSGRLTSSYGVRLGEGDGGSYDFIVADAEPERLKVSSAKAWTNDSIRIVFSHAIDTAWAGKKLNYTVYDPDMDEISVTNAIVSTSGEMSGREVFLGLSQSLTKGEEYTLRIEYIPDLYKQSEIDNEKIKFSGSYPKNKELELMNATSKYNDCILLTFNKALDKTEAVDTSKYKIKGISNTSYSTEPAKVYYSEKGDKYTVKLFLPSDKLLTRLKRYTVYVDELKDSLGNVASNTLQDNFTGGGDNSEHWISDAVTISKDSVKLTFSTEIAFSLSNLSTSNYYLEYAENGRGYSIAPIGVTYVDAYTLVLRFDELDSSMAYKLRVGSITDYSEEHTLTDGDVSSLVELRWGE